MKHLLSVTSGVESIRYFVVRPGRSVGEVGGLKWMVRYYRSSECSDEGVLTVGV